MSALNAPQPIAEPAFTLESLNPDKPQDKYKVFRRLGKMQKKEMDWALSLVAQRELKKGGEVVTPISTENWIMYFSKQCPDAEITILEFFIKPAAPNMVSVEDLYRNDKLEESFVEGVTGNFTMSSLSEILLQQAAQIQTLQAQIKELTMNSQPALSTDSESTEKTEEQNSDISKPIADSVAESKEAE